MAADGEFAHDTLMGVTDGIASSSDGDARYAATDAALTDLGQRRDALARDMRDALAGAAAGQRIDERDARALVSAGRQLLADAQAFATGG